MFYFGRFARCPRCGTFRLRRLRVRDRIDPVRSGILNLLKRLGGGSLLHCRYCRIQFYDRRPVRESEPETSTQSTARAI